MNTIQEVSVNTLKVEAFLTNSITGVLISYTEMYDQTKIVMDEKGKTYLRTALRRLKMPYETVYGVGIKMLSKDNATRIVVRDVVKIDSSVRKAEKTTKQVRDKVFDELPKQEQENIQYLGNVFGAIRAYSSSAKKIFKKQPIQLGIKV